MAKKYVAIVDTETVEQFKEPWKQGKQLVWNIGFEIVRVCDGKVAHAGNYVAADVYECFKGFPYLTKEVQEKAEKDRGIWLPFKEIYKMFNQVLKSYDVQEIWAYNSSFDKRVLKRTCEVFDIDEVTYQWRDIWKYAEHFTGTKKYVSWCIENGYVSDKGNPKTSAEVVGWYLFGITSNEEHLALADVRDFERPIFLKLEQQKIKKPTTSGQGWRKAAKVRKEYFE